MGSDELGTALVLAGVVLLIFGLHPFTTYPLSLALLAQLRPRRPHRAAPADTPSVALCVCAYNEATVIAEKIRNMVSLRAHFPQLEILIYVDGATDGTAEIVRSYGTDVRLVMADARHGKTHGMNTLVAMTAAEFVIFTDANVTFASDAVAQLLSVFSDPDVGCVCGHLVYTSATAGAVPAMGLLYWRLEERIKELETATGNVMGADGSIFAIRRALHRPPAVDLIDDFHVSLSVLCDGWRVVRCPDAIAYEETVSRPAEEFQRKIRIACQAFNVHRALLPRLRRLGWLDRYKYVSHKLLRWLAIYLIVASGVLEVAGLAAFHLWLILSLLILCSLALPVIAWLRGPSCITARLLGMFAALFATGLGVWRSLRGERFQVWTPPASARIIAER